MAAMDEAAFETLAAETLRRLADAIEDAADAAPGDVDVELAGGVLTIELDHGGTFVVNKHAPLQQLWLSSPVSGAAHFAWDEAASAWLSTRGGAPLLPMLADDLAAAGIKLDAGATA